MITNRLPELLKAKREKKGLSQTEVADAIGKSLRAYQYYEEGEKAPREATLHELAKVLAFDLSEIYEPKVHTSEPAEAPKETLLNTTDLESMVKSLLLSMEQLTRSRIIDAEAGKIDAESRLVDSKSFARLLAMVEEKTTGEKERISVAPVGTMGTQPIK